jgi:putative flavoprotein involved in K+ transport
MADYLEHYARTLALPVRSGVRVERVSRFGERFLVVTNDGRYDADNVVVAMATYQRPRMPAFSAISTRGSRSCTRRTIRTRRNCSRAPSVVGAGNSGAEIALEAAPARDLPGRARHRTRAFQIDDSPGVTCWCVWSCGSSSTV